MKGYARGKRWMALTVLILFLVGSVGLPQRTKAVVLAATETEQSDTGQTKTFLNDNINAHDYTYGFHAKPVNSYLVAVDTGYMRVQCYNGTDLLVEYYGEDFSYQSALMIAGELPIFGGFYAGSDAYYLVWGQNNTERDDGFEVIRVVKYDKQWNRLAHCPISAIESYKPICLGLVRMTEANGYLFLRTMHVMYPEAGGHQTSLTLEIRESDMQLEDMSTLMGMVSHCFNTYVLADENGRILTLDQGDGSPRASRVGIYLTPPGDKTYTLSNNQYAWIDTMEYMGEMGDNTTRATLGGLAFSDTSVLIAGTSIAQDENYLYDTTQNLYLQVVDRKELEQSTFLYQQEHRNEPDHTQTRWLTDFVDDDRDFHHCATVPKLVKLESNRFLLIWSETEFCDPTGKLYYEFLDGEGQQIGKMYTKKGDISDCEPVLKGNQVVWYTLDNQTMCFYSIDSNTGALTAKKVSYPKTIDVFPKHMKECCVFLTKLGALTKRDLNHSYQVAYRGEILKKETHYRVTGGGTHKVDGKYVGFSKKLDGIAPYFYGNAEFWVYPLQKRTLLSSVTTHTNYIKLTWPKEPGALGYKICRGVDGKKKTTVATLWNEGQLQWKDTDVKKGHYYSYTIQAFTKKGNKNLYAKVSEEISALHGKKTVCKKPKVTSTKRKGEYVTITVKKDKNASGFEFQTSTHYGFEEKVKKKVTTSNRASFHLPFYGNYFRVRSYRTVNGKKLFGNWTTPYPFG